MSNSRKPLGDINLADPNDRFTGKKSSGSKAKRTRPKITKQSPSRDKENFHQGQPFRTNARNRSQRLVKSLTVKIIENSPSDDHDPIINEVFHSPADRVIDLGEVAGKDSRSEVVRHQIFVDDETEIPSNQHRRKLSTAVYFVTPATPVLPTPRGKKTISISTPLTKSICRKGLSCMSPTTRKQMHRLGKGSFGQVIVGKYKGSKRAMKIIKAPTPTWNTREAWALYLDHPNIIKTVDVHSTADDSNYIMVVMEYVGAETLQSLIDKSDELLHIEKCIRVTRDIASALEYCHDNYIIHMDVKPNNIVLTPEGKCKLADFGCCINLKEELRMDDTPTYVQPSGTIPYIAPEIFRGHFPSFKADVYSLAIVMCQIWNGTCPYSNLGSGDSIIYKVVAQEARPHVKRSPSNTTERQYISLFSACWCSSIKERLTANDVVNFCSSFNR